MSETFNLAKTLGILLFVVATPVLAHRPIFSDKPAVDAKDAVVVTTPDVSQVIYRPLSEATPRLWLTFQVKKGFELFVQIGVPKVKRLSDFRPSVAVIGPGLPPVELPFPIPEKAGGRVLPTTQVKKPRVFHEHFTGTDSWILRSETLKLPEAGRYYVVAFSPTKQQGKLWIAVGKRESFGVADLLRFPSWRKKIRSFHEVANKTERKGMPRGPQSLLIDDFSRTDGVSSLDTRWRIITDRVMGGLSKVQSTYETVDGSRYLRLTGTVSLKNNGGFIQARLPLAKDNASLDAKKYRGVRLRVKGNGKPYYVHLRTNQTVRPWQYYAAQFATTSEFRTVELPFERFSPQNLTSKLDTKSLRSIAVVAAKRAFKADLRVAFIEFYQ